MTNTLLVMAGGTGGHVFPGLAVAEALKAKGWQVLWLGTSTGIESTLVPEAGFTLVTLPVTGLRGHGWGRWVRAPFTLMRALWVAIKIIRRHKPTVALGMGGFASGPGGLAAWLMGVPLVIHEQNAAAGATNRLLAPLARWICEGFPGVFSKKMGSKVVYTGNPLRATFQKRPPVLHKTCILPKVPKRLLILGGSRGAHALNVLIPQALSCLPLPLSWTLWHQTGKADEVAVAQAYKTAGITAKVEPFIEAMSDAYEWADLVICRSGALTVAELAAAGVPSLLIPYPYAVDDHQAKNAQYLVDKGAAWMVRQETLTQSCLLHYLNVFQSDPQCAHTMAAAAQACARREATAAVVKVCEACTAGV